jgi:hypothetical protein
LLMLGSSASRTSATVFFAVDLLFVACFTVSPPSTPTLGATSDGYAENPRGSGEAPFTKIPFNPHKGIMTFAPIRPGVLKEIGTLATGPDATETVTR